MSQPPLPELKTAAEFAKSLIQQFDGNIALVLSSGVAAAVPAFLPSELPSSWKMGFGTCAIFCLVYLASKMWFSRNPSRQAIYHLKRLGVDEKDILKQFLLQDKRTGHLNALFAPSASLVAKGILTYASSIIPAFNAPVVIQPYAWDYLNRHPDLVGLTMKDIGKDDYANHSPWCSLL